MAALDFPASPTDGQIHTENGVSYQYDAAGGTWLSVTGSTPVTDALPNGGAAGTVLTKNSPTDQDADFLPLPAEPEVIIVALSDESTAIASTGQKAAFRMPFAMTLSAVRASLTGATTTGAVTVDINEAGASILSTKLTIDATEKTSTTAATPAVISDTALADDAEVTFDVDDVADGTATGLKVMLIGTRT